MSAAISQHWFCRVADPAIRKAICERPYLIDLKDQPAPWAVVTDRRAERPGPVRAAC